MDKLAEIFRMQEALNKRIGVNLPPESDEEQAKWLLNYSRAMQQEMAELVDSVPWKWWAKYQKFDKQNAKVEIVDMFHFLVSMAQTMGMSADDMFEEALKENVAYVIGSAFHCDGSGKNTMRLNFSYATPAEIDEGIKRLATSVKKGLVAK